MNFLTKKKDDGEDKKEDADKDKKEEGKDDKKPTGADGDAKEGDGAKICSMKRGDYMIHLMVEQAKEL